MRRPARGDTHPKPVLLIGPRQHCERSACALEQAGLEHVIVASLAHALAACPSPRAVFLCAESPAREQARETRAVSHSFPRAPVIVLAAHLERWELRALIGAGASGVLVSDDTLPQRILACLNAAISGQLCAPLRLGSHIAPPALSTREKQVLGLVVMGYMNCQIAERLYLAESTVKSHLSSAFGKLGVRSRNEAANLILDPEHGLGSGILRIDTEPAADDRPRSRLTGQNQHAAHAARAAALAQG